MNSLPRTINAYPWHIELQTRFGDMDLIAHINNTALAQLFEETRVRFNHYLKEIIPGFQPFEFVIAHLSIDFLAEAQYPASVHVGQAVTHIGTTSLRTGAAMFQDGKCLALCDSVLVHRIDKTSTPLPQTLRDRLAEMTIKTGD